MSALSTSLTIYTDGSSLGNPGPGGWGALLLDGEKPSSRVVELGGYEANTTNNKMELQALISALEYLSESGTTDHDITVFADSKYVLHGLTDWINGWERKGWRKADGKPVLNQELWRPLVDLKRFLETDNKLFFEHVKAHAGHTYNERVDDIARGFATDKTFDLYDGAYCDYDVSK